jgi:neutral ceramidase
MLKAGASRIKITPPVGVDMAGYANRPGPAEGVHDDLYVRALVLSGEGVAAVLVVADVLLMAADFVADARRAISAATGLAGDHIIVAATHTHAGPGGLVDLAVHGGALALAADFLGPHDPALQASLRDAMVEAAGQALADQQPVRVAVGAGKVAVGANRRSPDGPADADVVVVRFDGPEGQTRALLFSQACHPTVLGADNRLLSGDFLGLACQALENESEGVVALGLTGAAGDVSTRATRKASTFDEAGRMAGLLAETIRQTAAALNPEDSSHLWLNHGQITLPTPPAARPEALAQRLNEARRALEALRRQDASRWRIRQTETAIEGIAFQLAADGRRALPESLPVEVYAVRIGPAALITFPVELFAGLGLRLRQEVGVGRTLIACYANDYLGYAPTHDDYARGGYEIDMALLAAGSGERLVAYAIDLLRKDAPS